MAGRQEVGDRLASPPGIPTSRFWPSDDGKSDGKVSQMHEMQESGQSASSSSQTLGHNFHNLDYFRQQEDFFATLDAGEEVNPQAKGAKGGYPWGSAGLSIAAKAMGSVWRSVAVPKAAAPAPAPASFAMDTRAAMWVNSAGVAKSAPASAAVGRGASSTAFHAVWCHERCHKHDAATLRAQLQLIMSRFEGELICQKTAGKFKLWLDDHSGKPDAPSGRGTPSSAPGSGNQCGFYVLLSDWRQLKPCMDILAEEDAKQPAAVILLCEQKGFAKAQLWNDSRPSTSFPLYFLQIQEDRWVAELEQIISRVKQPALLQPPWTDTMAMVGTPFYDAVREPLSTRFSL
eukprot:s551_g16.t1